MVTTKPTNRQTKEKQEPDSARGTQHSALVSEVWDALAEVPDPEIPMISVVDLGIIRAVERDDAHVRVEVMPTFVACPALDIIRETIRARLAGFAPTVEVVTTYAEAVDDGADHAGGPPETARQRLRPAHTRRGDDFARRARSARIAARTIPRWKTPSARPSAAPSTTATIATSPSSSSKRSENDERKGGRLESLLPPGFLSRIL